MACEYKKRAPAIAGFSRQVCGSEIKQIVLHETRGLGVRFGRLFGKQPYWPGTLWRRNVAPAIERACVSKPKLGWHTLRTSYASSLFYSGASLRVSKERMRHRTAEMTLQIYAQMIGDAKRNAGQKVASLVLQDAHAA